MRRTLFAIVGLLSLAAASRAEIKTQVIEYKDGDTTLEGFLAWDDAITTPRPGVLVVHDWNGLDDYEKNRARQLAGLGYVAFAADIYGKGVRPANPQESAAQAGKYRNDIPLFRSRLMAGLNILQAQAGVDKAKLAAIGYCFGGGGVLELARSGAPVVGVVSFHGALGTNTPEDAKNIKGKVLAIQGAGDPAMPQPVMLGFLKEMRDAKVDFQFVQYDLDLHAFTVPGGNYDEKGDKRSWAQMKAFFSEIFG